MQQRAPCLHGRVKFGAAGRTQAVITQSLKRAGNQVVRESRQRHRGQHKTEPLLKCHQQPGKRRHQAGCRQRAPPPQQVGGHTAWDFGSQAHNVVDAFCQADLPQAVAARGKQSHPHRGGDIYAAGQLIAVQTCQLPAQRKTRRRCFLFHGKEHTFRSSCGKTNHVPLSGPGTPVYKKRHDKPSWRNAPMYSLPAARGRKRVHYEWEQVKYRLASCKAQPASSPLRTPFQPWRQTMSIELRVESLGFGGSRAFGAL